jgi:hypothetical protein
MQPPPRQHIVLTIIVIAAAIFLAVWGCPYLRLFNHHHLCIALYILLFLLFIYGRVDARRQRIRQRSQ